MTSFKSVMEDCTSSTICITLYWGILRVLYMWVINVTICSFDFNFPVNHHRRGKCFAFGFRVFGVVINFAHLNQLGLGFS